MPARLGVAGGVLLGAGLATMAAGLTHGQGALTTTGIVAVVLGLACLRALFWVRRARLMSEVGRSLHGPDHPKGGSHNDESR